MYMDMIDNLRHWLIRKLSCGDLVMINFSIGPDGVIDSNNLGPCLVSDFSINGNKTKVGISVGDGSVDSMLAFKRDTIFARYSISDVGLAFSHCRCITLSQGGLNCITRPLLTTRTIGRVQ